jgi:hypothetical protein
MKKHFPPDGTEMFNEFERKKEALFQKRMSEYFHHAREHFHHRSRGLTSFRKELEEAVEEGKDTDWGYDGEDEYPISTFDKENAARAVFNLLKRKGLLKYIK